MNTGDWWWDTHDQHPAGAMIVPVICVSDKTQLTNFSGDQHAWPLYLMSGNIRKDFWRTPTQPARILVGLIPCPRKGAKNTDEAWPSAVGTVLSPLRNLDITGPGLKWNFADGSQCRRFGRVHNVRLCAALLQRTDRVTRRWHDRPPRR